MGWSATVAACNVMDALWIYCKATNEKSNCWHYKGIEYFAELGREFNDGHISMTIYKSTTPGYCKAVGSIYIEPNGRIRRMPVYLHKQIKPYLAEILQREKEAYQEYGVKKGGIVFDLIQ